MTERRVPEAGELAEDLADIKRQLEGVVKNQDRRFDALLQELKAGYVPRELYEARHTALRSEVALEMAAIKMQQDADRAAAKAETISARGVADSAKGLSMWALGLICTAVVVALVGFLVNAGGSV